ALQHPRQRQQLHRRAAHRLHARGRRAHTGTPGLAADAVRGRRGPRRRAPAARGAALTGGFPKRSSGSAHAPTIEALRLAPERFGFCGPGSIEASVETVAQSNRMFAALMTGAHFLRSAWMCAANSSVVLPLGQAPRAAKRLLSCGSDIVFATACCNRATMADGVPVGTTSPCHSIDS